MLGPCRRQRSERRPAGHGIGEGDRLATQFKVRTASYGEDDLIRDLDYLEAHRSSPHLAIWNRAAAELLEGERVTTVAVPAVPWLIPQFAGDG